MSLDEARFTRDYLYGRLLALSDNVESMALGLSGEIEKLMRAPDAPIPSARSIASTAMCTSFFGSMNPQLDERTGFSDADAEAIEAVLPRLFENDASSARPEDSMTVLKMLWWEHHSKAGPYSSARFTAR